MTTLVDELSQKALELPPEERILRAERLPATVHEVDAVVEAAWDEEIQTAGSPVAGARAGVMDNLSIERTGPDPPHNPPQ